MRIFAPFQHPRCLGCAHWPPPSCRGEQRHNIHCEGASRNLKLGQKRIFSWWIRIEEYF